MPKAKRKSRGPIKRTMAAKKSPKKAKQKQPMWTESINVGEEMTPAKVREYIQGVNYPATKEDILQQARAEGAGDSVQTVLEKLEDKSYENPADLSEAIEAAFSNYMEGQERERVMT